MTNNSLSDSADAGDDVSPVRLIARIDIKGKNVIKGIHLEGLRVVGQPAALSRKYYLEGADELLYMDVVASLYGRNSLLPIIEEAASEIFVPMTVGGGIRSVDDATRVLRAGADKVAINTAAVANPELIGDVARSLGSQCVVLSVEAKKRGPGQWEVYTDNGRERTGLDVLDWVVRGEQMGAGELLVTSVDMEGTQKGFDLELMAAVRGRVSIPIVAAGGAGTPGHVSQLIDETDCDAVAFASVLHYDKFPMLDMKAALRETGIPVRL